MKSEDRKESKHSTPPLRKTRERLSEQPPRRLELLYEISKLFATLEDVEQTFDVALGLIAETMRLRSAILIEDDDGECRIIVWPSTGLGPSDVETARSRAEAAYAYLVGAPPGEALNLNWRAGTTALPPQTHAESEAGSSFIALPLVVAQRGIFGALQVESSGPLDTTDLVFVNAIANQLAVAVDRHRAWRHDVSRREQAEALTEKYQALVDNLDRAFVWEADAHTLQPVYVSARAETLLGYPRGASLEGMLERVLPEDRESVRATFRRALVEKQDQRCDHRSVARDGRVLWFRTGVHLTGAHTDRPRLQGVTFDITAEKNVEEDLRFLAEASNLLGKSLDHRTMLSGIARIALPRLGDLCLAAVLTPRGEIHWAACAHVDSAKRGILDEDFRGEPTLESANHPLSRAIRSGASELLPNVDDSRFSGLVTRSEHARGVRSCITTPLTSAGRRLGAVMFAFAESGRRHTRADLDLAEELAGRVAFALENARLYEQAQQAIRVREQILAIVSHDLRNPLGTIVSGASLMVKEDAREELCRKLAPRMQRAAESMERLVEDLLDFVNIEAGRLAIELAPEEPAAIVAETVASFQSVALQKKLQLRAEIGKPLPQLRCDRARLLQVLSNLVGNALKLTPAGGQIVVRVQARPGIVLFMVSDTGPGIGRQDVAHIFERYWRSGEVAYKGTGLGLAIAKGIVSAHGGRIWVESAPGEGASFFFTIPSKLAHGHVSFSEA